MRWFLLPKVELAAAAGSGQRIKVELAAAAGSGQRIANLLKRKTYRKTTVTDNAPPDGHIIHEQALSRLRGMLMAAGGRKQPNYKSGWTAKAGS